MKCIAFLAFVAFIAGFLPNRIEGKCYQCTDDEGSPLTCKAFGDASADGREKYIVNITPTANCKKCLKGILNGEITLRGCAPPGIEGTEKELGLDKINVCDGDLCNGDNDTSSKSTGSTDNESSKSTAGSLKSWASVAFVATALSFMMGPLF